MSKKQRSRKRRAVFFLVWLLGVWLLADFTLYWGLGRLQRSENLFWGQDLPSDERLEKFRSNHYDPDLGWDLDRRERGPLGARKAHDYPEKERYKIKVYGDSFTYAYGVPDEKTWEYLVEEKTGWECINFGVKGYGTDQALLKYERSEVKTEYTVLAVLDENIGRLMTVWWPFYWRGVGWTKPRFRLVEGEGVKPEPNPVRSEADLKRFYDEQFIRELEALDYWPGYYRKAGAPLRRTWPITPVIAGHFPFFRDYVSRKAKNRFSPTYESTVGAWRWSHLYAEDSKGLTIMKHVVDEFVRLARERGEKPIIVLFPSPATLQAFADFERRPYDPLRTYLAQKKYRFLDFADVLRNEDVDTVYQKANGHFTAATNEKVAAALVDFIQSGAE